MNLVSNKKYTEYLNIDIIEYILEFTCIYCNTCKKKYNINFYTKLDKFYYCSRECFNHI